MQASKVIGIVMLVMMALCIYWVLRSAPDPPVMPADGAHARFDNADTCLLCHGPNGVHPRPKNHPISRECMRCHTYPKQRP